MKKYHAYLCPAVFFIFLFSAFLLLIFSPGREYSENEKRYLTTKIEFSGQQLLDGKTQETLEGWTEDQFPQRNLFVGINAYWNLLTGRNVQQDIYYGSDGYLISAPATDDLTMFSTSIERFEQFAAAADVPASLILVPSSGWLQEDHLPHGHALYPDETMLQLAKEKTYSLQVVDLWEALRTANMSQSVSYRTDHHLTAFGCYTLYCAWRQAQELPYLSPDDYEIEAVDGFYGTAWSGSGYWLIEPDTVELWDAGTSVSVTITDGGEEPYSSDSFFFRDHLRNLDMYPVYLDGNHCQVDIENPNGEGTLLILKDSYAHCVAPFLAEHYKTIIMIDLRYFRGSISDLMKQRQVDELLFLYGTSTLLTDSNSAWLF